MLTLFLRHNILLLSALVTFIERAACQVETSTCRHVGANELLGLNEERA